eukprot:scaffold174_cov78-Skeletonema_dohrnii-CCMP3373.AAC.2
MCWLCELVDYETSWNRPKASDCLTLERLPRTLRGRMDAYSVPFDSQGVEDSNACLYASIQPFIAIESTTSMRQSIQDPTSIIANAHSRQLRGRSTLFNLKSSSTAPYRSS